MKRATRCIAVVPVFLIWVTGPAGGLPNVVQEHYRWRANDGSEAGATWLAAADQPCGALPREKVVRLRFCLSNADGLETAPDVEARLEYSTNRFGGYLPVPETPGSAAFANAATAFYTNAVTGTTDLLPGSGGAFQGGFCVASPSNASAPYNLQGGRYANFEYCLRPTSNAVGGRTYYFRLTDAGVELDEYQALAEATVIAPAAVHNATGATHVTASSAQLNGSVTDTGGDTPFVYLYWGDSDQGTARSAWDHEVSLGAHAGPVSASVTGLTASTLYYYRCYATNAGGGAWAPAATNFTTRPAAVAFSGTPYRVGEKATNLIVTVALRQPSALALTVNYAASNGTALAGSDYTSVSGTLAWAAWETGSQSFSVPVVDDSEEDDNEVFYVVLSHPTNSTVEGSAVQPAAILDDDGQPTVQFTASSSEGEESLTPVYLAIVVEPTPSSDVTVRYAVAGGTASNGADYALSGSTATVRAGESGTNIVLAIVNDAAFESNETVVVRLSSPTNAVLGLATDRTHTILDTDPGRPAVNNGKGATDIRATSATVRGQVVATRRDDPRVIVYYGTSDGVTNKPGGPGGWSSSVSVGTRGLGEFATNLTSLATGSLYYYRCYATNAGGDAWAPATENFIALDPPTFPLLTNGTFEIASGGYPYKAANWDQSVAVVSRSNEFARTGSYAFRLENVAGAQLYGRYNNHFKLSWNGQYRDGGTHPGGGLRPGFVLSGTAHSRARVIGSDPARVGFALRNVTDGNYWMSGVLTNNDLVYQELAIASPNPLPPSEVNKTFVPGVQRLNAGTSPEHVYMIDDVSMTVLLPRLQLERDPATLVVFSNAPPGVHADLRFGARSRTGGSGTVLYGAYVTNSADLSSSSWNCTAWEKVYDPGNAFRFVGGRTLACTNGDDYSYATIRFAPPATGVYTAVVRIATTDPKDWYPGGGRLAGSINYEQYVLRGTGIAPPGLSVADTSLLKSEGTNAAFRLTLATAIPGDVTLRYATSNGTAEAGADYVAKSGSATIPAGATTATVNVRVLRDMGDPGTEVFYLNVSSPTNAVLTRSRGACTIIDDTAVTIILFR